MACLQSRLPSSRPGQQHPRPCRPHHNHQAQLREADSQTIGEAEVRGLQEDGLEAWLTSSDAHAARPRASVERSARPWQTKSSRRLRMKLLMTNTSPRDKEDTARTGGFLHPFR